LVFVDRDLFERGTLEHFDEGVASDLLRKTGAPRAQHTAFAVEQHLRRNGDRLGVRALHVAESRFGVAVRHRLVLQRALAALVAHRAVERVVDEQQFDDAVLRLLGHGRGVLRLYDHAFGDRGRARRHRLLLALDLDQALTAGADRVEQWVLAETRDLDADELGRPNHQRALGHRNLEPIDCQRHQIGPSRLVRPTGARRRIRRDGHQALAPAKTVDATGSNGQPLPSKCAMYSSRKYWIDEVTGLVAPSPRAQNARPRMLSERSSSVSMSCSSPSPRSSR